MSDRLNHAIDFHDSTLVGVTISGDEVTLSFRPAYVHKSAGRPGWDPGSGWWQDAFVVMTGAAVNGTVPTLPCELDDGTLDDGQESWEDLVPLPMQRHGSIRLHLIPFVGEPLDISATGVSVSLVGEGKFEQDIT